MKDFKPTKTLVELLADDRNLVVIDRDEAERFLRSTNYYRFTGYSRHFQIDPRNGDNNYVENACFEEIVALMLNDDELRIRLLVALSELEMTFRTRFAHLTGRYLGNKADYLRPQNYLSDSEETLSRLAKVKRELVEAKAPMVARYRVDADVSELPIWVAIEVLSFGKTTWMLETLKEDRVRSELASYFSYEEDTFPRVMHSLANLRNMCAHHGQLWNRKLSTQCPLPINKRLRPRGIDYDPQGLFPAFLALKRLVKGKNSLTQLRIVERKFNLGGVHSKGLLTPEGVK